MNKKPKKRKNPKPPRFFYEPKSDILHTTVKAGLQTISLGGAVIAGVPVLSFGGGALAEFYSLITGSSVNRRRDEFLGLIIHNIQTLSETVEEYNPLRLADNEAFISTLLHAVEITIRTHQEGKKEALKNAVLNSALPNSIDDNLQLMFLSFIDSFTPVHLKVLNYLLDPKKWKEKVGSNIFDHQLYWPKNICTYVIPELRDKEFLYKQIYKDLKDRGLVDVHILKASGPSMLIGIYEDRETDPYVTDYGKLFLQFISQPEITRKSSNE